MDKNCDLCASCSGQGAGLWGCAFNWFFGLQIGPDWMEGQAEPNAQVEGCIDVGRSDFGSLRSFLFWVSLDSAYRSFMWIDPHQNLVNMLWLK